MKEHRFWRSLWWYISPSPVIRAHDHCHGNKDELLRSPLSGCFFCLGIYPPSRIKAWVNGPDTPTALCPECRINSVIGSESGYPVAPQPGHTGRVRFHAELPSVHI